MAAAFYFHGKYGRNFGPLSFTTFILLCSYKAFENYSLVSKIIFMVILTLIFFFIGLYIGLKHIYPYEEEPRRNPRSRDNSNPSKPDESSNVVLSNSNEIGRNNRRPRKIPQGDVSPLLKNENAIALNNNPNLNKESSTPDPVVRRPIIKNAMGSSNNELVNNKNDNDDNKANIPIKNERNLSANPIKENKLVPRRPAPRKDIRKDVDPIKNINANSLNNSAILDVKDVKNSDINEVKQDISLNVSKQENSSLPVGDILPKNNTISSQPMKPSYRRTISKRSDQI